MRPLILAALLILALASAALADTRCTTRYDEALQRWVTTCAACVCCHDDGGLQMGPQTWGGLILR
jgi:cytochrome c553